MASSRFMVNAANPILLRSSWAMMKSRKTKGRILNRSFRIVLASMDIFGGWFGSHGHLQRQSAYPNDFIGRVLLIRGGGRPRNSMPRRNIGQVARAPAISHDAR